MQICCGGLEQYFTAEVFCLRPYIRCKMKYTSQKIAPRGSNHDMSNKHLRQGEVASISSFMYLQSF